MLSTFPLLLSLSGLSQREAAEFLNVRVDTVKSWASGRRVAPTGALENMRGLIKLQKEAAREALALMADIPADATIELGVAQDDDEARAPPLSWPCRSAQLMMLAHVVAALPGRTIVLVPRDHSIATSAAVASHEQR